MRKIISLLLLAAILLGFAPLSIQVQAETDGYYAYTISDGEVTITELLTAITSDVIVPSTLGGYPVTSIGDWAFYGCDGLTSFTIPDSVTSIGKNVFDGCSSLTGIWVDKDNPNYCSDSKGVLFTKDMTCLMQAPCAIKRDYVIPDGVTSIGASAFQNCTDLLKITIPDSVTSIGNKAFAYCQSLTNITIPEGVTAIGVGVFTQCTSLTGITIPNSVTSIGDGAFIYCSGLSNISIPDSVTSIGEQAFYDCSNLTDIPIPKSVTKIEKSTFSWCDSLTSITIPEGVTSIGENAFGCCANLTNVTIPDGVTSIGRNAFANCDSLTSITIPDSVTRIGNGAFLNCSSLETIYYAGTEEQWNAITIGSNNDPLLNANIIYNYHEHSYVNGTCACGATEAVEEEWTVGSFNNSSNKPSLVLEGEIFINLRIKLDGIEGIAPEELIEHMGLAVFYTKTASSADSTVETADAIVDTVSYDPSTGYFIFQTNGIPAKNMGDDRWFKAFVTLPDGTKVYSGRFVYSPKRYVTSTMSGDSGDAAKALCVALMNYGAAAQEYFAAQGSYTYETLMNADLDAYQSLVNDFDASMLTDRIKFAKTLGIEGANNSYFGSAPAVSISLEGAIDMNFTCSAGKSGTITTAGFVLWNEDAYTNNDTLTLENATEILYASEDMISGSTFRVTYAGTPAKEMGNTVFAVAFYEMDGITYYSGVVTRSIEYSAKSLLNNANSSTELLNVMEAMVLYGDHARNYFAE